MNQGLEYGFGAETDWSLNFRVAGPKSCSDKARRSAPIKGRGGVLPRSLRAKVHATSATQSRCKFVYLVNCLTQKRVEEAIPTHFFGNQNPSLLRRV